MKKIFDLKSASPAIWQALQRECPQSTEALKDVAPAYFSGLTTKPGVGEKFYRLPNHARSICRAIGAEGKLLDRPVVVFKGAEPLLDDFVPYVDWLARTGFRGGNVRSKLEHFPLAEGKVAGVCLLNEIALEGECSIAFQEAHLKKTGKLARVPLPLAYWQYDDATLARVKETLRKATSDYVWSRIETFLSRGIALGAFHYPSAPVRADFLTPENEPFLRQHSDRPFKKSPIMDAWMELVARMLSLNFLPLTIWNWNLGSCLDPGNICLDGGACDVDSLYCIRGDTDDFFVYESLHQTVLSFAGTLAKFSGINTPSAVYAFYRTSVAELGRRVQGEADPRIRTFLEAGSFGELLKLYSNPRITDP